MTKFAQLLAFTEGAWYGRKELSANTKLDGT